MNRAEHITIIMPFQPNEVNLLHMRALHNGGQRHEAIAFELDCSITCVEKWTARFVEEANGGIVAHDLRRGNFGVLKLSDQDLHRATDALNENPFRFVKRLPADLGLNVSEQTLRTAIKTRSNLRNYKAAVKAVINAHDAVTRLEYANNNINRTAEQWRRTIFVDEKTFSTAKDGEIC